VAEFQKFCKPFKNSTLKPFCTELTGITQEQVDAGENFPDVLTEHFNWLMENTNMNVVIMTCGFWDLGTVLIAECKKMGHYAKTFVPKFHQHQKRFCGILQDKRWRHGKHARNS